MKTFYVTIFGGSICETAYVDADYFEVENECFYFYEVTSKEEGINRLKAVYPLANTVIKSIIYTDENKDKPESSDDELNFLNF